MYKAVNNFLVLKEKKGHLIKNLPLDGTSMAGKKIDKPRGSATLLMKVVSTNEHSKEFKGADVVIQYGWLTELTDGYYACEMEMVKAIKE